MGRTCTLLPSSFEPQGVLEHFRGPCNPPFGCWWQPKTRSLLQMYWRIAGAIMFVYAITSSELFDDAKSLYDYNPKAQYRHPRRHFYCAGMGVPVLKTIASGRRSL